MLFYLKRFLYFLSTGLILIAPAIYNRYPLMYFDSGAYMEMSINLEPSFHRSIGYPLLLKLTGWGISNWPMVVLQGILVSWLLYRLFVLLFAQKARPLHFLSVVLLTFFSSLAWYTAQLMPDVFSFILGLLILILAFEKSFDWNKAIAYGAALFFTLLTHLSHIPLLLLMLGTMLVLPRILKSTWILSKWHWGVFLTPMIAAWLFVSGHNAYHNMGFGLSGATNVFVTANIGEMDFLKLYLDENCDELNSELCTIKDSLPLETGGFLWDGNGPVQTHPKGWEGANEEYAPIVHDFLFNPRYLKWLIFGSIKATVKQMFQIELGSGLHYTYGKGSPPYWPMRTHFKQELSEYLGSVQNRGGDGLPISFFRYAHYIGLLLSVGVIGWLLLTGKLDQRLILLLLLVVAFYFFHAAITGVLANVYDRLQCRVLPLVFVLALISTFFNSRMVRNSES